MVVLQLYLCLSQQFSFLSLCYFFFYIYFSCFFPKVSFSSSFSYLIPPFLSPYTQKEPEVPFFVFQYLPSSLAWQHSWAARFPFEAEHWLSKSHWEQILMLLYWILNSKLNFKETNFLRSKCHRQEEGQMWSKLPSKRLNIKEQSLPIPWAMQKAGFPGQTSSYFKILLLGQQLSS